MNYAEYNTEYQKVILKEQLKRGLKIKTTLMDTLKTTDNKQYLEFFLQATDFDGYLANNEQALEDLGQDEEFKELIEQDTELLNGLKKTAEERLGQLKEQDKDKDKNKDEDENTSTLEDDEEKDEHTGRSHNEAQNSSTLETNMDSYKDTPYFKTVVIPVMPRYGTEQYYVQSIKANVASSINSMHRIKENIDRCPSPMMLAYMSNLEDFFTDIQKLAVETQNMPQCDEELRMLTDQQIEAAQQVKDTVQHYIEQYQQKFQESTKKKDDEEKTLEDAEEQLQQGENLESEDKKQEELEINSGEQEDEKGENLEPELEQDDETPRKSWELSPQQKVDIQRSSQQVAQEYNERQANPQPEIQEPNVQGTEMEL